MAEKGKKLNVAVESNSEKKVSKWSQEQFDLIMDDVRATHDEIKAKFFKTAEKILKDKKYNSMSEQFTAFADLQQFCFYLLSKRL